MDKILSVLVIGLSFGFVLFLVATGLSLTMGLMRIVNMAHGALFMIGGFVGLSVAKHSGNFVLGAIAGAACAGLVGILLEVGFLRRLHKQEASQVLLTIGFIYILMNIAQWIWGALPASGIAPSIFSRSIPVGSVELPIYRLVLIGFGVLMAFLLWQLQDKTKIGAKVRAGMDNRETANALGINLKVVFTGVFALGSVIAGMCGLIGSTLMGVNLNLGWEALVLSLIVVVVGGAGSVQGALLGGVILGLLNAFGAVYFPKLSDYVMYIALIVILVVRPRGLLGKATAGDQSSEALERASSLGSRPSKRIKTRGPAPAAETVWQSRLRKYLPYAFATVLLVVVPPLVGTFTQGMITKVLIFALLAMSLDLLMGYTGLLSFGHAVYFAIAGYAVGVLTVRCGISSFWLVFPMSLAISAALAAIIGYFALRVSGVYFLLITMAFGQLLSVVAVKWGSLTRGIDGFVGIERPDLGFGTSKWTNLTFYYFVFAVFAVSFYLMHRIVRSAFGRTLTGIRANEPRMKSIGFNTWAHKYAVIIIAGVFAGVAGALHAYSYGVMVPRDFALEMSALPMLMVIIGGGGTLWGPCLGAAVIVLAQHYSGVYLKERWPLILGALFVLCVMLMKGGFSRYLSAVWAKARWPRARKAEAQPSADGGGRS